MCVVAETILISDFEGDMHYGLTLVTTAIARDVQGPEQYIVRDYRLKSVATEKEAIFAEVTTTTEVPKGYNYLSSNKLLPVCFFNHLYDHSTMEFLGIPLVHTCWLLLYFESFLSLCFKSFLGTSKCGCSSVFASLALSLELF
jgi:hypothetical protein